MKLAEITTKESKGGNMVKNRRAYYSLFTFLHVTSGCLLTHLTFWKCCLLLPYRTPILLGFLPAHSYSVSWSSFFLHLTIECMYSSDECLSSLLDHRFHIDLGYSHLRPAQPLVHTRCSRHLCQVPDITA